ncbi:CIC11C00000001280 [Sungouiella intermedia]|uniref:CIC11C00000001280 n=1 Tax=Sungouiella intermedia TaxID=45354 RepID=A0A1L0G7Y8_9ASCO|nr:CIC11C00000001280 [[Candida] intermedia]
MASILNSSKFLPSYSIRNILWGFQLAILGTYYSLKNPKLFKQSYYVEACRVSFLSISLSLAIRYPFTIIPILVVFIGLYILLFELFTLQCFVNYFQFTVFNFFKVVRVSGNLNKELNELFLVSLEYMDLVDHQKHPDDTFHQYHYKLEALSTRSSALLTKLQREQIIEGESTVFFKQHIITALLVMVVSCFPYLLLVGSIVPALIIFLGLRSRIGIVLSCVITAVLLTLPKEFSMMFLILYWGSRNMVHDLLLPYFSKVKFSKMDKDQWIKSREGLLLGFSMCYYTAIIKFPWVGLLIYGLAESSMAYMIRKISEPPPDQMQLVRWTVDQLVWKDNKTLDDGETRNDEKSASSTEEEDKVDEP